jgi:type IV pilus assembly protein PilM
LDLSDRSLKYIQLGHHGHNYHLKNFGQETIPLDVVQSGQIKNKPALIEILKKARIEWGLQYVAAALPEESAYIVQMTLPAGTEGNEREAIELQLEEYVPLPASDAIFDFEILPQTAHDVIVSVFPRNMVADYEEVLNAAGLRPVGLEVEAQAIARAVVPRGEAQTVLAIDFGRTRTSFFIVAGGEVVFSSTTRQLGGDIMTRAVEKHLGLSTAEAETLKLKQGLNTNAGENLAPALAPALSVLRDEILKLESYWEKHSHENSKAQTISRITLCGGEAALPGLMDYLHGQLNVPVELANVWVNVLDTNHNAPSLPQRDSLAYATAIGLALRNH